MKPKFYDKVFPMPPFSSNTAVLLFYYMCVFWVGVGDEDYIEVIKVLSIPFSQRPPVTPIKQAGFNTLCSKGDCIPPGSVRHLIKKVIELVRFGLLLGDPGES